MRARALHPVLEWEDQQLEWVLALGSEIFTVKISQLNRLGMLGEVLDMGKVEVE